MSEREGETRLEPLRDILKDRPDDLSRLLLVEPYLIRMLSGEITAEDVNAFLDQQITLDPEFEGLFVPDPSLHKKTLIAALRINLTLGQPLTEPKKDDPPVPDSVAA